MLFNSFEFLCLFLLTFFIYYIPDFIKLQIPILIVSSLIFYSWNAPYLLILLLLSIFINSFTSFQVSRVRPKNQKLVWAFIGIFLNLFILATFKYGALLTNLFTNNLDVSDSSFVSVLVNLPLPIGISFYTFEGISLLVDVLRAESDQDGASFVENKFNNHLLNTSFFIAFFPHLIAGPILKASNFYPQIKPKYFSQISWSLVLRSLIVGFFLKMVIADNLKDYTFWIAFPFYQLLSTSTGLVLLFGYSMQIFADFAGYSLIAIGTAAALGYNLPQNFNFPYISRSLSEFWRRWHISLSDWLKNYLYIPLGGNRKGQLRTYANLMIVMVLGGLWHGASWSYAVWGGFHGVGLVIERFFNRQDKVKPTQSLSFWLQFVFEIIRTIFVFSFVSIGWLLFKLPDFGQALDFINTMIHNVNEPPWQGLIDPVITFSMPVVVYHVIYLPILQKWQMEHFHPFTAKAKLWSICQDIALGVMLALIILNSGSSNEFIYFQF